MITSDQLARVTVCVKTLGWTRDQTTRFLASGWQVDRLSRLHADQAEAAIAALVEALAVWATDGAAAPTDADATPHSALRRPHSEDADWAALGRVDRPDAPALPEHVAAIAERFAYLCWHPQHQANHLTKHYGVTAPAKLTIAQAAACCTDLDARIALLPQGVTP